MQSVAVPARETSDEWVYDNDKRTSPQNEIINYEFQDRQTENQQFNELTSCNRMLRLLS